MNFVLLFNMMMWIPQDPFNTGALHAFLLNLDDIPIITRKNKHAMPIMAIKTNNLCKLWQSIVAMTMVTKNFPIIPNPVLHLPQTSKTDNGQASNGIIENMAANSTKLVSLTSTKTAPNLSPGKVTKVLDVDAETFVTKESKDNDDRLKTVTLFLNMYGLEDINTTHSVFKSLAQYLNVDVGPTTSTLSTRTLTLDTLAAAMADMLQKGMTPPSIADVMTQAEEFDKMILTPTPTSEKNTKAMKIPKKLKDNAIIEIEDNETNPNEQKGKTKKR